tara:strand:- start:98 stop:298 length:201 start_codon:yes stop_codon:yes gene_type:complete
MSEFLMGVLLGVFCGLTVFLLTFGSSFKEMKTQTRSQKALITQCELKLTRDRVCVLQAVPELEISK